MPSAKWMRKKLRESIPVTVKQSYACFETWRSLFLQATDKDRWGEKDNAIQTYQHLLQDLQQTFESGQSLSTGEITNLMPHQRDTISNILLCLTQRIYALQNPTEECLMPLEKLIKIKKIFRSFDDWKSCFPILIMEEQGNSVVSLKSQDSGMCDIYSSEENLSNNNNNNNNPKMPSRLPRHPELSRFSIQIQKFGIKDMKKIKDPYLAISLRDRDSVNLTDIQYTKCADCVRDYNAEFNSCNYEVQRYLEKIPKGSSIFFELRSSSDKKTKYYAMLSSKHFVDGKGYLELYKGPVDYHQKQLRKVSQKKPLYCHIDMTLLDNV